MTSAAIEVRFSGGPLLQRSVDVFRDVLDVKCGHRERETLVRAWHFPRNPEHLDSGNYGDVRSALGFDFDALAGALVRNRDGAWCRTAARRACRGNGRARGNLRTIAR